MLATDCDRYGCTLGGKRVTYGALRHYVCDACGGAVAHRFMWDAETETTVDSVACAACGGSELITESRYDEQISDGWEVMETLPPQFRALYQDESVSDQVDAQQAIDELF